MARAVQIVGAGAASVFALFAYAYLTLPDVRPLKTTNPETTAFIDLRAREAADKGQKPRREQQWVKYSQISPQLKRAVLVAEDAAFWDHDGVDYEELQKSIETDWARGEFVRGASTITQQLAKNLYLSPSKNPVRKLRELIIARRMEAELEKARILELYLNLIEWGDGVYGVEAAARKYFGTSAASLGASESALLAGAIINPRVLTPARPTPRLLRRQQLILKRMGQVTPPVQTTPVEPLPLPEAAPLLSPEPPPDAAPEAEPDAAPVPKPFPEPREEPPAEPLSELPLPNSGIP
jgi:monofunctional biosynthetic peptidoglycan transglycosylase